MRASPIRIPTVNSDTDWDFCFHLKHLLPISSVEKEDKFYFRNYVMAELLKAMSQQTKTPAHERTDELYSTSGSGESEEDTKAKEEKDISPMSLPKEKLAQSQKKIAQLIKGKMNIQANKELIRCVMLSRIVFGEEHWKCAQALANLAYGYLTLRGLPAQAKKHAESAKNTLLTWKGNMTSDKEKEEILEALVMLYYTLGVAWLLQHHGREAYFNLQRSERNMKELKESYKGGAGGLRVSEKDLAVALGRASLANGWLNLALTYFEKAIGNVIAAKGARTSGLVSLYKEIAQIEQLRRNHDQAIQYLQQAHSICVSLFTEVSTQAAEASALLAKAYAVSGEAQYRDAVEIYFLKSITAYQTTLGPEDYETLNTVEEFCKWLIQNGEKQEAYRLLKASLKSQVINYGDYSEKVAETFYNMSGICFAKGELKKAIRLLRKSMRTPVPPLLRQYLVWSLLLILAILIGLLLSVKRTPLYKTTNNKANLVDNKTPAPQNIFINTDSDSRSKAEPRTLGGRSPLSSSITGKIPKSP